MNYNIYYILQQWTSVSVWNISIYISNLLLLIGKAPHYKREKFYKY